MEEILKTPSPPKKLLTRISIITFAVIGVGGVAYSVYAFNALQKLKAGPEQLVQGAAQEDIQALLGKVGRLVVLPEDETPTVATVTDVEKLKSQAFFANAYNGDKVIIYGQAKKAILYSPAFDKIVEIAPINMNNPAPTSAKTSEKTSAKNATTTKSTSTKK